MIKMEAQLLDYTLVPCGLLVMLAYHLWLLHRIRRHPTKTVIGINAINRRFWVRAMMEDGAKNGVLAVQTLRNNIMASTLLASTAIMLSSLIAVLMTGRGADKSKWVVAYGEKSEVFLSVKFFLILVCFLLAFAFDVQSIRYYSHASILINVPLKKMSPHVQHHQLTTEYVAMTVNKGSYFWSIGLRAFYFSFPLFLWIFGPVPMFLCCVGLASMLYSLDTTMEFGGVVGISNDEEMGGSSTALHMSTTSDS